MLKKMFSKVKEASKIVKATVIGAVGSLVTATQAFAATTPTTATSNNADLDAAANQLIGGIGDMKTDGLVIITVCILLFVAIFGIGWLIRIVRKKMSSAS